MFKHSKIARSALSGAVLLAGVVAVSAQEVQAPAPGTTDHQQMMRGGGMPMMEMMQQMSRMMESCNKMMQSHMDHLQPNK
jgi:hypothetical protein